MNTTQRVAASDGVTWQEDVIPNDQMAVQPAVSAPGGRTAVVWYDFRDYRADVDGDSPRVAVWSAVRGDSGWPSRELVGATDISRARSAGLTSGPGFAIAEYGAVTPIRRGWLVIWALGPPEPSRTLDVYALPVGAP